MDLQFPTATAAGLAGASVRQLDSWARTGLLKPTGREASGRGSRRRYTFNDVVALKTIVGLRAQGCPLQRIRKAVTCLRDYFRQHKQDETNSEMLARLLLLTDGREVYICTDQNEIMEAATRQIAWSLVALGRLILQAQDDIKKLPTEIEHEFRHAGQVYHLVVWPDASTATFTVQCRELPGAIEQGDTVQEAISNGMDAVKSAVAFMARRKWKSGGSKDAKTG
jgi:DNA-binding transcriptional MerR regulator/predicted RNase H-like HicB family nuclease